MKTELKRELTLQDLAPYLPYGLKGMAEFINIGFKSVELIGFSRFALLVDRGEGVDEYCHIIDFKPLLIPLSELIRPEYINIFWKKDSFLDEITEVDNQLENATSFISRFKITDNDYCYPYDFFSNLFKHHFDVFGLLDAGLALNKNEHQYTK